MRREGADAEVAANLMQFAGHHRDQRVWRALALHVAPAAQQLIDWPFDFARHEHRARLHPLERALREVIAQPRQVIHVRMRNADEVAGERKVRAATDVEADVEFGDLHDGLFAGDAVADDVRGAEAELGELLHEKGAFWSGWF